MDVVIMKLTNLRRCKKGIVSGIGKYHHECRLHGIKTGTAVDVVYHYTDKMVIIINHMETIVIPKIMAEQITVEVIK